MEAARHAASRARSFGLQAVKTTAAAVDRVRAPKPGVVFLSYHSIGSGSGLELDVSVAAFDEQMAYLAEQRSVLDIAGGLAALDDGAGDRPDPVVVTFDDGTADFADHALPILARHGVPATLYLASAFVEEQRPFPYGTRPLSWAGLRDACSTGLVTVGSHTHSHALLDRADSITARREIDSSRGLIAERLGRPAEHFAYPKGVPGSGAADQEVRRQFRSAALAVIGANVYGRTDRYRLRRSPVQASDGMRWFVRKVDGGMRFESTLRESLNRIRYAGRRQ